MYSPYVQIQNVMYSMIDIQTKLKYLFNWNDVFVVQFKK